MATVAQHIDERAWLEERKKSIGGSEVAAIFGEHPFLTAHELWERKTGRAGDVDATPAMERGKVLEPVAADRYVQETGRKVRRMPMRRNDAHPHLHANVDRQVLSGPENPTAALEIKVPGYQVFAEIREKGIRPYMILQGQVEALVTGYPFTSFGILHADSWRFLHFDLEADPDTQEMIANEAGEWWHRYVEKDTPPPEPDYGDLNLPEVEGELARIEDPEWERTAAEWIEAEAILDQAKAIEKPLRDKLQAMQEEMGARALQGGGVRTYLTVQGGRRSYKKELDAIAKVGPLDPDTTRGVLATVLDSQAEAERIMEALTEHARLELPEITGNPFPMFRPYILRASE